MKPVDYVLRAIGLLLLPGLPALPQPVRAACTAMESPIVTYTFGVEAANPDPGRFTPVDYYHTDLIVDYINDVYGGGWSFAVAAEQPGDSLRLAPENALLTVNVGARVTMPAISGYEFIGAAPGSTIWILPQNYLSGVLWLGFNSGAMTADITSHLCTWNPQDTRNANTAAKWLRVELVDVRGPENGHLSLWQTTGIGGAPVFFSTFEDGITDHDVFHFTVGSHSHLNWGFTQPGVYEVDLRVSTLYQCDEALTADFTGDCFVNLEDASLLAGHWLADCSDPNHCVGVDLVDPNYIDHEDLLLFTDQWLECGSPFENECPQINQQTSP